MKVNQVVKVYKDNENTAAYICVKHMAGAHMNSQRKLA